MAWKRQLKPASAFSNVAANEDLRRLCDIVRCTDELGRQSRTVRGRILSSCAGWRKPPSTEEFYEAIRAVAPTKRQTAIIGMWWGEATDDEIALAWSEEVYTYRELAQAVTRTDTAWRNPLRTESYNRLGRKR